MARILAWLLLAWAVNYVGFVMFGYPVVYCLGSVLLSPLYPVVTCIKMVSATGLMISLFFGWWSMASGFGLVAFAMTAGGSIFSALLSGHLCH